MCVFALCVCLVHILYSVKMSSRSRSPKRKTPNFRNMRFNVLTVPSERGPSNRSKEDISKTTAPTRELRRGEVGKDLNEIAKLESSGFVMSGSRNSRMNAIREINETAANEAVNKIAEKQRKEEALIEHFRNILLKKNNAANS